MKREEISKHLKWNVADVFADDAAWEQEYKSVETEYANYDFDVFKGKLSSKETLLSCLHLVDTISRRIEKLYLYANLRHDEDVRVSKYTSSLAMVGAMMSKIFARLSFIEPELTTLKESVLNGFIADPDFAPYD